MKNIATWIILFSGWACSPDKPTPIETHLDLTQTIQPPEHMANIWWYWEQDYTFENLAIDFTIHNDPGDFSDEHGLYLMLCYGFIADVDFYFGLQTDVKDAIGKGRGKGLIFSRWETRDLANAKIADATEGFTQSAGHEGDFIGVRRTYDWGAGDYQVRLAPDGSEADGEWFGVWITDKASNQTTWIGSLKFPYLNGKAVISSSTYTTLEIYGRPPIRLIDIPQWHVSFHRPSGDGVKPKSFSSSYSPFTEGKVVNSNVQYDPTDSTIHFQAGFTTQRTNPEQVTFFD